MTQVRLTLLFLLTAGVASAAYADGKFFRHSKVVDDPGIVAQRGLVAWRDGVQTLIVQSDLSNVGESAGWILPLPAPPTTIEACPGNTLTGLAAIVQPQIINVSSNYLVAAGVLALILILACLDRLRVGQGKVAAFSPACALVLILLLAFTASLLLPSLGTAGGGLGGVTVLHQQRAGVYDVIVIRGDDVSAVEEWLRSGGFETSGTAREVLRDYVEAGWCFLAARVSAEAIGQATQHPLAVSFPIKQPIYPMRLTGVDGQPVQLDLFVIGDRRALVDGMKTWVVADCQRSGYESYPLHKYPIGYETPETFRTPGVIGLPAVSKLMWHGCVITRLRAQLVGEGLMADLPVRWGPASPTRARVYGRGSALTTGAIVGLLVGAIVMAGLSSVAAARRWTVASFLWRRGVVITAIALVAGATCYAMLEVVPAEREEPLLGWRTIQVHEYAITQFLEEPPEGPFPDAYRRLLEDARKVLSTSAIPEEAADPQQPGEYRIEQVDDGWRLTIVDRKLVTVTIAIDPDGKPRWPRDE